ncbi:MAG: hypothetical protein V7542_09650 [Limnobacter sp.]|uniref:hypothetical protein n=1 Tax=Limnobacter sp. TaxID=2003368 RepID=UPI0030018A03
MKFSKVIVGAGALVFLHAANSQDLDNSKLPKLNEIKPIEVPSEYEPGVDPLLHGWAVSLVYRDAETSDKTRPTVIKEDGYQLGVGFRIGEDWFGRLTAEFADQKVDSQPLQFPIDLKSDNETDNYTVLLGHSFNPVFSVAGFYGQGKGTGVYDFPGGGPVAGASDSDSDRYGLIGTVSLPFGKALTSTSLTYLHSEADQTFPPGNLPPTDSFEVDVFSLGSSLIYPLGDGFSAIGNLAFNHIGSQKVAAGSTSPDENWFSGGVGLSYQINANADVRLSHQRWIGNSTTAYRTTGLELVYRF